MQILQYRVQKLGPYCWGTFALVDLGKPCGQKAAYSISTDAWPTGKQMANLLKSGKRLPAAVAAHYFPEAFAPGATSQLVAFTSSTVAA